MTMQNRIPESTVVKLTKQKLYYCNLVIFLYLFLSQNEVCFSLVVCKFTFTIFFLWGLNHHEQRKWRHNFVFSWPTKKLISFEGENAHKNATIGFFFFNRVELHRTGWLLSLDSILRSRGRVRVLPDNPSARRLSEQILCRHPEIFETNLRPV